MGVALVFTVATSCAKLTATPGLPITTATTTPAMAATAKAAAGGETLASAPRTSERAHHEGRVGHHQNGSHRLADCVRHLQDQ